MGPLASAKRIVREEWRTGKENQVIIGPPTLMPR